MIKPRISYSSSEDGFALPVAIGLGLIMLLLGVTMIVRSQNDQVNASAQKATAESLAAAEVGVSKFQALINRYRAIATYSACPFIDDNGDGVIDPSVDTDRSNDWRINGTCSDTSLASWAAAAGIVNIDASCDIPPALDPAGDISSLYFPRSAWLSVGAGNPSEGEYRLVDYVYGGNPGQPGGTGLLTVQGRVNGGSSGESVAQVQVEIPVQPVNEAAALWVRSAINGSTPDVKGKVVGPCTLVNVPSAPEVIRTAQSIPAVPPDPSAPAADFTQPLGDSNPDDDVPSQYSTTATALSAGNPIKVLSESNVQIWVSGNIDWRGQEIQCVIRVAPDIACNPGDAFKVTVYATGASNLQIDSQSVLCNVHFHAPGYDVQFTNAGSPVKNCGVLNSNGQPVHLNGSFWVNSWSGGTGAIALDQSTTANIVTLPPQIAPIARWERQSVATP